MCSTSTPKTYDDLLEENDLLSHRLEEAEETIEALPRSVAILDRRGRVLSCNLSFADLLEKPQRSLIDANVGDFLDGENRPRWLQMLQDAAFGEARGECSFRRGDGGVFPAAVILQPLSTKSIRLELVDLTATRDRESILEAKKQLEKSEEMNQRKDEFLATLAHELRNPLAPILTSLQLLRMEDEDAEARRQSYDVIERQTRQLTRLVDDLMDVVRISRGKIKLQKNLVDLAVVVGTAIESSRPSDRRTRPPARRGLRLRPHPSRS